MGGVQNNRKKETGPKREMNRTGSGHGLAI